MPLMIFHGITDGDELETGESLGTEYPFISTSTYIHFHPFFNETNRVERKHGKTATGLETGGRFGPGSVRSLS